MNTLLITIQLLVTMILWSLVLFTMAASAVSLWGVYDRLCKWAMHTIYCKGTSIPFPLFDIGMFCVLCFIIGVLCVAIVYVAPFSLTWN